MTTAEGDSTVAGAPVVPALPLVVPALPLEQHMQKRCSKIVSHTFLHRHIKYAYAKTYG